jgi:hypothetical protein
MAAAVLHAMLGPPGTVILADSWGKCFSKIIR